MVKVYSYDSCPYCTQLKSILAEYGINFLNIDITLPENKEDYDAVVGFSNCHELPIISIDNQLLIPEISFRSIPEAANLTKKILG